MQEGFSYLLKVTATAPPCLHLTLDIVTSLPADRRIRPLRPALWRSHGPVRLEPDLPVTQHEHSQADTVSGTYHQPLAIRLHITVPRTRGCPVCKSSRMAFSPVSSVNVHSLVVETLAH